MNHKKISASELEPGMIVFGGKWADYVVHVSPDRLEQAAELVLCICVSNTPDNVGMGVREIKFLADGKVMLWRLPPKTQVGAPVEVKK